MSDYDGPATTERFWAVLARSQDRSLEPDQAPYDIMETHFDSKEEAEREGAKLNGKRDWIAAKMRMDGPFDTEMEAEAYYLKYPRTEEDLENERTVDRWVARGMN